jgi:hypothetical protein
VSVKLLCRSWIPSPPPPPYSTCPVGRELSPTLVQAARTLVSLRVTRGVGRSVPDPRFLAMANAMISHHGGVDDPTPLYEESRAIESESSNKGQDKQQIQVERRSVLTFAHGMTFHNCNNNTCIALDAPEVQSLLNQCHEIKFEITSTHQAIIQRRWWNIKRDHGLIRLAFSQTYMAIAACSEPIEVTAFTRSVGERSPLKEPR